MRASVWLELRCIGSTFTMESEQTIMEQPICSSCLGTHQPPDHQSVSHSQVNLAPTVLNHRPPKSAIVSTQISVQESWTEITSGVFYAAHARQVFNPVSAAAIRYQKTCMDLSACLAVGQSIWECILFASLLAMVLYFWNYYHNGLGIAFAMIAMIIMRMMLRRNCAIYYISQNCLQVSCKDSWCQSQGTSCKLWWWWITCLPDWPMSLVLDKWPRIVNSHYK